MKLDFVGVGPQRAGTTWLHVNLAKHPEVLLPRAPVKETFFFDEKYEKGMGWYWKHFDLERGRGSRAGEIGPSYFDVPEACQRIRALNSECRIIINVRNPVDRAFSLFLHHLKRGRVPADFDAAVAQMPRILTSGHYAQHVPRWLDTFGPDRVHFVFLDDFKTRAQQSLADVCRFLQVEPMDSVETEEPVNAAWLPRWPWVEKIRGGLHRFARERQLYPLLRLGGRVSRLLPSVIGAARPPEDHPLLTESMRRRLTDLLAQDISYLEGLRERSQDGWRNRAQAI